MAIVLNVLDAVSLDEGPSADPTNTLLDGSQSLDVNNLTGFTVSTSFHDHVGAGVDRDFGPRLVDGKCRVLQ